MPRQSRRQFLWSLAAASATLGAEVQAAQSEMANIRRPSWSGCVFTTGFSDGTVIVSEVTVHGTSAWVGSYQLSVISYQISLRTRRARLSGRAKLPLSRLFCWPERLGRSLALPLSRSLAIWLKCYVMSNA